MAPLFWNNMASFNSQSLLRLSANHSQSDTALLEQRGVVQQSMWLRLALTSIFGQLRSSAATRSCNCPSRTARRSGVRFRFRFLPPLCLFPSFGIADALLLRYLSSGTIWCRTSVRRGCNYFCQSAFSQVPLFWSDVVRQSVKAATLSDKHLLSSTALLEQHGVVQQSVKAETLSEKHFRQIHI